MGHHDHTRITTDPAPSQTRPRARRRSAWSLATAALGTVASMLLLTATVAAVEPDPAEILRGSIVGADGGPVAVEYANLYQVGPDGAEHRVSLDVAPDGTFEEPIFRWGTAETPATIFIQAWVAAGEPVINDQGCTEVAALTGTLEIQDTGAPLEAVVVVADTEGVLAGICGATAAPTGDAAPAPTLPPTDMAPEAPSSASPWSILVTLAIAFAALLIGPRRRTVGARRSR